MLTQKTTNDIASLHNINVLIVEDDQQMQQRLQRLLATPIKLPASALSTINASNQANSSSQMFESVRDLSNLTASHDVSTQLCICKNRLDTLEQLQRQSTEHCFNLALLDLTLPDGHGLDLIPVLREKYPNIIILVITVCAVHDVLLNCIKAGANGYLLKEREDFELSIAIKHALNGAMPIDPFMAQVLIELSTQAQKNNAAASFDLSQRELEILKLVTQGFSNRDIADQLNLSRYTIDTHIRNIYAKLAVNNRSKAIAAVNKFKLF